MGTIAEKLTYLNTTKIKLRDSLNKFGSSILSTDTFRSYDTKLNEIYDKLPKITQSGAGFTIEDVQNGLVDDFKMIGNDLYQNQLPSEYTAVEYLQSNGNQYIDTGINADSNLSLKFDFSTNNHTLQRHMGAIKNEDGVYTRHHITLNATASTSYIGSYSGMTNVMQTLISTVDDNKHYLNLDIYNKKISADNQTPIELTFNSFDTNLNYWLFARNSNNSTNIVYAIMKIYYCKMYYQGNLVRDFVPCYRNSDSVAGLYDFVTNTFFTNQGTGTFTVGNDVALPNPDYPQDIKVVEGRQVITDSGKNLFDVSQTPHSNSMTSAGVTLNINDDGTISTSGTNTEAYRNIRYDIQLPAGEYIISGCPTGGSKNGYSLLVQLTDETSSQVFDTGSGATFSLQETTTIKFYPVRVGSDTVNFNGLIFKPMIRLSNISNDTFEPYYEPVNYNIDLNLENVYLAKIPNTNYKNKIYKNNGNWYYEKNVEKYLLDGTRSWRKYTSGNYTVFYIENNGASAGSSSSNPVLSDKFKSKFEIGNNNIFLSTNGNRISISTAIVDNLEEWSEWLSTHNVIVYYALANPVTTQITNTTLINQLEVISVHTGTNIIELSSDNNMTPQIEITRLKELERLT